MGAYRQHNPCRTAAQMMLESMPEDARIKVFEYTQTLFTSPKPANPFTPKSQEKILNDLEKSRKEIDEGLGLNIDEALRDMGERHGFV